MGAAYVMRAAQSKGKVDLLALFPPDRAQCYDRLGPTEIPDVWLVQCKRDGRLSAAEAGELIALAIETGTEPILAKAGPKGRGVVFINLRDEGR